MRWSIVLIWMILIFLLSNESADGSQGRSDTLVAILQAIGLDGSSELLSTIVRKSAHAMAYAVLGALIMWALAAHRRITWRVAVIGITIACIYAVSDEIHQTFIPGRSGEVRDVLIDTVGAAIGVGLVFWGVTRRQSRFTTASKSDTITQ